jgi:pimeloyl-ACP methyl ester carboxylesterase
MSTVTRHFVELPHGVVHYATAGQGEPVLLLHQTPRSWDEFRDVLPLLGRKRRAIAMDTAGFGDSTPLPMAENSIPAWADVAIELLDALEIEQAHLVGHHTGAVIATRVASSAPGRVRSVVLSSSPFDDAEARAAQLAAKAIVDDVEPQADGSHLLELWRIRAAFYPAGNIDLLERFLVDALRAGPLAAAGHQIVASFDVPAAAASIRCPVLLIGATDDPYAYPALARMRAALPDARTVEIDGGMVPLPDQLPEQFATAVEQFLDGVAAADSAGSE